MRRDSMGLGPDALTLYCDAGHNRLDMAFVDVSGEPRTWRGFVRKDAVEGGVEHPNMDMLREPSEYAYWSAGRRSGPSADKLGWKEMPLHVACPRCRKGRLPQGRTLRVRGSVLYELVVPHGIREASLNFVEEFMKMRRVAN